MFKVTKGVRGRASTTPQENRLCTLERNWRTVARVPRICPGNPCRRTTPTWVWKIEGTRSGEFGSAHGWGRIRTWVSSEQRKNDELTNAPDWKSFLSFPFFFSFCYCYYYYYFETLWATSDVCTMRPVWKISVVPPTSRSAWLECSSFRSPDFPARTGGLERSRRGTEEVRGHGGTLPRCPLPLASTEPRARGGRSGAGACPGRPLCPVCPHPPWSCLLPGKRCRKGVQSAGRTWWLSPARLPLFFLVSASARRIRASGRGPPRFLTRLRLPRGGSSAR